MSMLKAKNFQDSYFNRSMIRNELRAYINKLEKPLPKDKADIVIDFISSINAKDLVDIIEDSTRIRGYGILLLESKKSKEYKSK